MDKVTFSVRVRYTAFTVSFAILIKALFICKYKKACFVYYRINGRQSKNTKALYPNVIIKSSSDTKVYHRVQMFAEISTPNARSFILIQI